MLVTEREATIGGNVQSRRDGDYLWEEGPNSFQPVDAALSLAVDAGLRTTHDIRLCDPGKSRFVFHNGDLHPLPASAKVQSGLGVARVADLCECSRMQCLVIS